MWGTLQVPNPSVGVWRKRLESNLAAPDYRHVLVAEVEGKVAGMLGLFSKPAVRRSGVYQLGTASTPPSRAPASETS